MRKASVFVFLLIQACQPPRFEPDRPEEQYNSTSVAIPKLVSTVNIPVEIPLAELERQVNSRVNGLVFEDNSLEDNGNDGMLLKVWKRDSIRVQPSGDAFLFTVPLKVWAKKGLTVLGVTNFQETSFSLNTRFVTRISVGPNWQAVTSTQASGYEWIEKPYLRLGFVEVPLTPVVSRILDKEQQNIANQIDGQLKQQLNLKPYVQTVWQAMQQPVRVSEELDAWLRVHPTEIWMTPLTANGTAARARIGIRAYTETLVGQKPAQTASTTVPSLQASNDAADDFQVGLTGEISHQTATRMAAAELVGKTFSFQNGKRQITIGSVDLYGSHGKLVIKTGVTGSLDGTLYLVGKPFFNVASQSVELRDLDFALDTKSRLLKAANWLAHGTLAKRMQENLKLPLGEQLETARKNIRVQLANRQVAKGIALNGTLDELTPGEVFITPQAIVAVVTARGKIDLKISGL